MNNSISSPLSPRLSSKLLPRLSPRLSLGPVTYYWDKDTLSRFYSRIADTPVDIVYLGETVCARRKLMRRDDWLNIAELLRSAGKEVVLSSMALIEARSELAALKTLCSNNDFMIEANDMSAVQLLSGQSFICGPAINIYNPRSLQVLSKLGLKRWVLPIELSKQSLADMQKEKPAHLQTEVLVYGRLPLAYSARCFTARAHNLPKDDCQYRCLDYPDGLMLSTREKEKFLVLNGIQTQSAKTSNLLNELDELRRLNVDILRISPPSEHCEKIIDLFYQCLHNNYPTGSASTELESLMPVGGSCNGYWHGASGMDLSMTGEKSCQPVQQ
ncbi:MAG TPA: U32 family peptidase [Gammaproteobacteria bacterium]|nr:U32 family peptidase [Gammaproteobacteria bacterium]